MGGCRGIVFIRCQYGEKKRKSRVYMHMPSMRTHEKFCEEFPGRKNGAPKRKNANRKLRKYNQKAVFVKRFIKSVVKKGTPIGVPSPCPDPPRSDRDFGKSESIVRDLNPVRFPCRFSAGACRRLRRISLRFD